MFDREADQLRRADADEKEVKAHIRGAIRTSAEKEEIIAKTLQSIWLKYYPKQFDFQDAAKCVREALEK